MSNILSIDVEEYFHANNLQKITPISTWDKLPTRVCNSTRAILELLEKKSIKATFFILGYVAKKHPELIKEIAKLGHEIASHGFMHQLVFEQDKNEFYKDVSDSKKLLQDLTGQEVSGYRAPSFSITAKSPWAYTELCRAGYRYDSSRYPIWHPRYNNLGQNTEPESIKTEQGEITVYPLATTNISLFGKTIPCPIAGGAYWRLLPLTYIKWGMRRVQSRNFNVYYFHPWEIDSDQPRYNELNKLTQLRHYGGTARFLSRLDYLTNIFSFTSFQQAIND